VPSSERINHSLHDGRKTVDTRRDASDPVAVIITRPPEIVVCLIIPTSLGNFFIVFDSHPRPLHPFGSGFIINSSLEATSRYLDELLAVDPKLFSDRTIRWQSDLLTEFSGHILVPRKASPSDNLDEILMAASMTILQLKADKADSRRQRLSHEEERQDLVKQIISLERRLEGSLDRKGKKKATNDACWALSEDDPSSKKVNKSPSSRPGQGSNRGWEDIHLNGATGGKPHKYNDEPSASYHNEPLSNHYGMLNPFSLWSMGHHNDPKKTPGINLNHDTQNRELVEELRESKLNSFSLWSMSSHNDPMKTPEINLNHDTQDRELAIALRESMYSETGRIPGMDLNPDAQDREPTKALMESYNCDVIKSPEYSALDRQMDLRDPSPPPIPPMQVRVDVSDVESSNLARELQRLYDEEDRQLGAVRSALGSSPPPISLVQVQVGVSDVESSNLARELQRFYDEEDRQLAAERNALKKHAQVESFNCGICFENLHRENIAQFASCKHRYCRSCLREHVSSTLEQRRYPIICPECKAKKVPNPSG